MEDTQENKPNIQPPTKGPQKPPEDFKWVLFSELAMEFAVITAAPLLIFLFLGNILGFFGLKSAAEWANYHRHNSDWYIVIGLFGAVFISFYSIYKKIREVERKLKK